MFHDGSYQPPVATTIGRKQPKPLQPVGGAYRPQAGDWQSVQPITVQLYDEFVARGNVAVLKCLINMPTADPAGSPLAPAAKVTYHNSQFHTAQHLEFVQQNFLFEWQVKSGPATSVSVRELITTLRSNQTQGKSTFLFWKMIYQTKIDELNPSASIHLWGNGEKTSKNIVMSGSVSRGDFPKKWTESISQMGYLFVAIVPKQATRQPIYHC